MQLCLLEGVRVDLVRNNDYDCVCPGTPNDEDMEDEDMLEVVFS